MNKYIKLSYISVVCMSGLSQAMESNDFAPTSFKEIITKDDIETALQQFAQPNLQSCLKEGNIQSCHIEPSIQKQLKKFLITYNNQPLEKENAILYLKAWLLVQSQKNKKMKIPSQSYVKAKILGLFHENELLAKKEVGELLFHCAFDIALESMDYNKRYVHAKTMTESIKLLMQETQSDSDKLTSLKAERKKVQEKIKKLQEQLANNKEEKIVIQNNQREKIISASILAFLKDEDRAVVSNKDSALKKEIEEKSTQIIDLQKRLLELQKPSTFGSNKEATQKEIEKQIKNLSREIAKQKEEKTNLDHLMNRVEKEGTLIGNLKRSWWGS